MELSAQAPRKIGFIQLQHDFFEALPQFGFTGRQLNVMLVLARKLIGFHKRCDDMSASQIGAACKTARQHVATVLSQLSKMNVIFMRRGRYGSLIEINMNFAQWRKEKFETKTAKEDQQEIKPSKKVQQKEQEEQEAFPELHWDAVPFDVNSADIIQRHPESTQAIQAPTLIQHQEQAQADFSAEKVDEVFLRPTCPDSVSLQHKTDPDAPLSKNGATDVVQGDRPEMVHTKDNLPKENITKENKEPYKKPLRNATQIEVAFAQFWERYPKKVAKAEAYRLFCQIAPDEALLARMLQAVDIASQQMQWRDPQMIPYPAKWLKRQSWLDVVQTAYSTQELDVIKAFNRILGRDLGDVDRKCFVESRAGAIRHFLVLCGNPAFMLDYFTYCRDKCLLPTRISFDWLLKAENFAKVCEGQYQQGGA